MPRDPQHDAYYEANRLHWDESTSIHEASEFYDRAGFLAGKDFLTPTELAELVPAVRGKRLLHLQCHFGMDTLNLARFGADATGVDFSPRAIEAANRLATDAGLPGRFMEANVYDAPEMLHETFDIVYVGVGSLTWLPNVRSWAAVVATFLEPGGFLYLHDGHPMSRSLEAAPDGRLVSTYAYFETAQPESDDTPFTYTDGPQMEHALEYEWGHGLGEVITALVEAGLRIDFVHEQNESRWQAFPGMELIPGTAMYRLADRPERVPLTYSLKATKLAR